MEHLSLKNKLINLKKFIVNKLLSYILSIFCFSLLIYNNGNAQFSFTTDPNTAVYSKMENSSGYFGISSGRIDLNVFFNAADIDTSVWRMMSNTDNGKYSLIQNKTSYMGIDSGLIKIPLIYLVNAFSFDTLKLYDSLNNSFEHSIESAENMDLEIIEWVKNTNYALKDSINIFSDQNTFWGSTNIYGSTNVTRIDTIQNILANWTFEKNASVSGILSVDTINNSSGNIIFKSSTGFYFFKSTNSSHTWFLEPMNGGEIRLSYSGNNNGLRITNTNTIYPNLNNDGDLGTPNERYRTNYLGTSLDILGTTNKIKTYYDATHGFEISANSTGGVLLNNVNAANSNIYFQLGGSSIIALSNYSSKTVFRPTTSNILLGDTGDRWGKSYFADNLDITWNTNVDAGFLRGSSDTDMTGIYLRSPNGTKYYITVDDSGVLNASVSPF